MDMFEKIRSHVPEIYGYKATEKESHVPGYNHRTIRNKKYELKKKMTLFEKEGKDCDFLKYYKAMVRYEDYSAEDKQLIEDYEIVYDDITKHGQYGELTDYMNASNVLDKLLFVIEDDPILQKSDKVLQQESMKKYLDDTDTELRKEINRLKSLKL